MQRIQRRIATGVAGLALIVGSTLSLTSLSPETAEAEPPSSPLAAPSGDRCEQYQGSFLDHSAQAMLQRAGVSFYTEDRIVAFPDPTLGIGSVVRLCRAPEVSVTDAKTTTLYRTWATTVGELLAERRIELAAKDQVEPVGGTSLSHGGSIAITRVAETELTIKVSLAFAVQYKDDPNLEKGKTKVEQAGSAGMREDTYLVRRENGVETSRTKTLSVVAKEPVAEIIIRGTKPVITVACKYQDTVIAAAAKHGLDPNDLCYRMMKESRGNPNSKNPAGPYLGLFQYQEQLWPTMAAKAGYAGASVWDPVSQIHVTAWAWANGQRGRWPIP